MDANHSEYLFMAVATIAATVALVMYGNGMLTRDRYYDCVNNVIKGNSLATAADRALCASKIEYKKISAQEVEQLNAVAFMRGTTTDEVIAGADIDGTLLKVRVNNGTERTIQRVVIAVSGDDGDTKNELVSFNMEIKPFSHAESRATLFGTFKHKDKFTFVIHSAYTY